MDKGLSSYAIDFDGVLAESVWPDLGIGKPLEHNIHKLREVAASGMQIVIHTARPWGDHGKLVDWLKERDVPFTEVVCGKLLAAKYVDDRAINSVEQTWMPPKVVYTGGTFDLLHWGHVNFLQQCAELGRVVVSLNPDEFVQAYKGSPPVMTYKERERMLRALGCVYDVVPNEGGTDSSMAIDKVKPNILAIGSDWATKDYYGQMGITQDWLDERGIWMVYINRTKGVSTTDIKERIK